MAPSSSKSSATAGPSSSSTRLQTFTSHNHLRHRLILSLLSHRPIRIDQIRPLASSPGLTESEVSFLRLLEKITGGTRVEINFTGTSLLFHPGVLAGGTHTHLCPLGTKGEGKSVGWFLEPLLAIGCFGKKDLKLNLKGITTDGRDCSVDTLRTSGLRHLAMFLEGDQGLELKITKRGHPPLGGGEITFTCPSVRAIKSGFDFTNVGQINKIRGIAHSVRVSPQLSNRLVASARSVLNRYIPDVYIYTDVYKGEDSGKSPGYALTLLATSTSFVHHTSETTSCPPPPPPDLTALELKNRPNFTPPSPEEMGVRAAKELLIEIMKGGCCDRGFEWLVCTMLVLGGEDVGKVRIGGSLDASVIQFLRDLRSFFGTTFKIKPVLPVLPNGTTLESNGEDPTNEAGDMVASITEEYILSCVGTGFTNTARAAH